MYILPQSRASLVTHLVKNPPAMWETWVRSLGWEDPLEKGKATHSSILVQRIPRTVQSMGSQSQTQLSDFHFTSVHQVYFSSLSSIFLLCFLASFMGFPGGTSSKEPTYQGRRPGFDPHIGKIPWWRNWQPLQHFCLENPTGRGAWLATVYRVAELDTTETSQHAASSIL